MKPALLALVLGLGSCGGSDPGRPAIVFLSIDTTAAKHLSLYGYERETTPNLERIAAESVVFERCKANAPRTLHSYLSQFSGLFTGAHRYGEYEPGEGPPYRLDPERTTLAEHLRSAGYRTAAFVDNPWLAQDHGFEQGFDLYDTSAAEIPHAKIAEHHPRGGIRHVVPRALGWIDSLGAGEPFFAFLQALDPHGPYRPVAPWKGSFASDGRGDERVEPVRPGEIPLFGHVPPYVARGVHPEGPLPGAVRTAPIVAAYDEKLLEVDAAVGELVEGLRARGVLDRAVLVVSADHGESMLEHAFYFAHGTLYDEVLHVPLLVRLPRGERGGARVATPAQLVDLFPTLAELAGAPVAPGSLHGRSLVPLLEGRELSDVPLFAEGGELPARSVELGGWKLVHTRPAGNSVQALLSHPSFDPAWILGLDGSELPEELPELQRWLRARPERFADLIRLIDEGTLELFDLESDPRELADVSSEHPDKVAELRALLEEHERRVERERARVGPAQAAHLDPSTREELRRLGYLPDGED